jgi:GWxTD domain-containing protein
MMSRPLHLFSLFVAALFTLSLSAQVGLVVESKVYQRPGIGPYVDVNMALLGGTAVMKPNERGFNQARVEVITIIEQAGAIKAFSKTLVLGPERTDSLAVDIVHQEAFDLAPGAYTLAIELRDQNNTDTTATRFNAPLAVGELSAGLEISEILLAERIESAGSDERSKYGYSPVPLLTDYLPSSIGSLEFYAEVYNSDRYFGKDSAYLLTYQLESYEKRTVVGAFKRNIRSKGRPVEPVIAAFDIGSLPSGNYVLAIEVRDRTGVLLARREQMIQRNNPVSFAYDMQAMEKMDLSHTFAGAFNDRDSLAQHIHSMRPIADPLERKIIDDRWKDRDMDQMRRFFYSFWANRSADPEKAWLEYREQVIKVNKLFGCRNKKGYETDRGYVYLKYGAPNTMMDRFNEMGTIPYSIWHYYRIGPYSDRRFVFYLPDLVTNCFDLLHSEMPGEVQNPQWNQILHARTTPVMGVQTKDPNPIESDRVREFYTNPR